RIGNGDVVQHVRLCHRAARCIEIVGTDGRRLGTKVANEGLEARFAGDRIYIAVMVSGDRYDRGVIIEIRLVKLRQVVSSFSVVEHEIAKVIKKRGPIGPFALDNTDFHKARYALDVCRRVHTAGIADGMKHESTTVLDALNGGRIENRIETHPIWRQSRRGRQIPPGLKRMFFGINDRMESRRHPVWSEGGAMTWLWLFSMMGSQITWGEYGVLWGRGSLLGHSLWILLRDAAAETSVCRGRYVLRSRVMTAAHLSIVGRRYMQSTRVATHFALSRCPRWQWCDC